MVDFSKTGYCGVMLLIHENILTEEMTKSKRDVTLAKG
ncbi:hypothetical protein B4110_2762 [Parageobacillus toebii]|uniref:Uncharacterized protein n=1 Tax=Parageobacillus toebii TaxID=153151 RepID=A0A150N284_9BACL|nr:hypothetical protein B4110_2762 [Parageobacillus toebii]